MPCRNGERFPRGKEPDILNARVVIGGRLNLVLHIAAAHQPQAAIGIRQPGEGLEK